jgi:uncharacterized protein (DUF2384 family)
MPSEQLVRDVGETPAGDRQQLMDFPTQSFWKSTTPNRVSEPAAEEGDRLANYERLVARTVEVFGDEVKASRWLSLPNPDLNGQTPLQIAQQQGYSGSLLEPILVRIEHGIDY